MAKQIFTTGDVARICGVSTRTATRWIDEGLLAGWRIPGGRDRRVNRAALEKFIADNGMPADKLDEVAA